MSVLEKTTSVLTLSVVSRGLVRFVRWNEDGDGVERLAEFDFDTWADMGRPTVITNTIEPGDRLNEVTSA